MNSKNIIFLIAVLMTGLTCPSNGDNLVPKRMEIGAFIAPTDHSTLPGAITCSFVPSHNEDKVSFHFTIGDSAIDADEISVTLQIGGEPGRPETSAVWAEIGKWLYWEDHRVIIDHDMIDSAYVFISIGGAKESYRLWDYFIAGTSRIVLGTLKYDVPCLNENWYASDIVVDRVIKGNSGEQIRVPALIQRFSDGLHGLWLLYSDESRGCGPNVNFRVIKFVPPNQVHQFLERASL
jgi:hypothetical protein